MTFTRWTPTLTLGWQQETPERAVVVVLRAEMPPAGTDVFRVDWTHAGSVSIDDVLAAYAKHYAGEEVAT